MRKALTHLKNCDPVLKAIIDRAGPYRVSYGEPNFETMVRVIVSQQLNGKVARTIYNRLAERVRPMTPARLLALSEPDLRAAGLSGQKAAYLRDLAERTRARQLRFKLLCECPDDQVIEHLTTVKGVGIWSAHMFLIFALRRPDVLPVGDLGVRIAIQRAYGLPKPPTVAEMECIAQPWRPWCSVAAWYLWRSLEMK